ncbi:uncharacterized protein LOC122006375 [Zingiber officinale]|uniref:uncharacterized protein LOC122006375 n=1 Tax=Zingiber officinale TaxID=94328 RepID=UPI001C4DA2E1|nr:uncharacterized protein LOC122006375 [Zingiber officinale]
MRQSSCGGRRPEPPCRLISSLYPIFHTIRCTTYQKPNLSVCCRFLLFTRQKSVFPHLSLLLCPLMAGWLLFMTSLLLDIFPSNPSMLFPICRLLNFCFCVLWTQNLSVPSCRYLSLCRFGSSLHCPLWLWKCVHFCAICCTARITAAITGTK